MVCQDLSFNSPQENIIYDDVLLRLAEQADAGEVLRFWESPEIFVVLGRIGKEEEDVNHQAVLVDKVPVLRRSSGGGTVVQGRGCLNYTLILSKEKNPLLNDLKKSYQIILEKVIFSLKSSGVEAVFQPISDLALLENNKKFSGNAQKRGKKFILHHGTILYDFDLSKIEKYLFFPKDTPEYRRGRPHLEFVTNASMNPSAFKKNMMQAFGATVIQNDMNDQQKNLLSQFLSVSKVHVSLTK